MVLPSSSGRPAVAPPEADVAGLAYTTSNDTFYRIDTALVVPQVDPESWTLTIGGRVRRPMTLTFDDLLRRPMIERYVTLACVSNEVGGDLIGNARWLGVPVKDLLDEAGPEAGADQVVSRSVDGFTAGTPTAVLTDGRDAMIAIGMNGEPLPVSHGFPARMVVPGLYGYVSATKWLAELELTTFADFDAYWIRRGWAEQAPIKTQSRIDVPRSGATVPAGAVVVAGVAWAQHRGISAVEVSVDRGLAAGDARGDGVDRHLAPVVLALGRHPGTRTGSRCGRPTTPARCRPPPWRRPSRTVPRAGTPSTSVWSDRDSLRRDEPGRRLPPWKAGR